jgi:UPF0716 family protein affecting phage T7 exclusion
MSFIALAIFLLLTAIAGIHVAWGTGVRWPRKTEAELVTTVIGQKRDTMPSPSQCYLAALAIFIPGVIALMLAGLLQTPLPPWLVTLAAAAAVLVFAGRGIAGYVPAWRARHSREPFASLDRHYYSPLCLMLAAGLAMLLANAMRN